jgi:hypothetical protein
LATVFPSASVVWAPVYCNQPIPKASWRDGAP